MYKGIFPAIVTPFKTDEEVDAFVTIMKTQEAAGVQGFYFCGTGGEGLMLTLEERKTLLALTMKEKAAATKIIVHISAFFPQDSITLAKHAAEMGADAVALLPPGYFQPLDDEAVYQYYAWITKESPLPMFIYHLPEYSHYTMSYALFERLINLPNTIGIKDSAGNVMNIFKYVRNSKHPVVLNGQDQTTITALLNGADGVISGPANVMPEKFTALWNAFQAGDAAKAGDIQAEINTILAVLTQYPLVPAVKQMMNLMGLPAGVPRRPYRLLTDEENVSLRHQIEQIGLL